jgi:DNA-binding response OmpR family regulator
MKRVHGDKVAVIAEDDPDVRDLIEIVLTQSGFTIFHAPDGPAAIAAVREHRPLLTTLDVNMPGMDGFAVAKRLREFSQTYLIMITALTQEIDIIRGFEAGADDYLVKPFRPRELRARADSMLRRVAFADGTSGQDPTPSAPAPPPQRAPESWAAAAVREFQEEMSPDSRRRHAHRYHADQTPPTQPAQPTQPAAAPPASPAPAASDPAPGAREATSAAPAAPASPVVPPVPSRPSPPSSEARAEGNALIFRDLTVDTTTGQTSRDGRSLSLTDPQLQLLVSLLGSGRRVRSKADLVLALRGEQFVTSHFVNEADKRAVEGHIAGLRQTLGDDEASPKYIETVKGVGFRLAG